MQPLAVAFDAACDALCGRYPVPMKSAARLISDHKDKTSKSCPYQKRPTQADDTAVEGG